MKIYQTLSILLICCLLAACNATQGLSVFSFTDAQLESALRKQLPKLSDDLRLLGVPVEFNVNDINAQIGPDGRDVIQLSLDSGAQINALMLKYSVGLMLEVEGSPEYNSQEKAIYLRNVRLLDSRISAGSYKGNLNLLDKQAMNVVNAFLDNNPVYKLDMSDPKVAMIAKLPLDMKVSQGAITVVPSL
ncbi:DUF1439 domain-containing protein [Ningiella sp. W23]|uniref:DUF1439 domain-containing protein n=1 Tax=Ningiella sp. W23 TaxID=3023715 RepID=UPI003756CFF8